jgi:hypothetical protein
LKHLVKSLLAIIVVLALVGGGGGGGTSTPSPFAGTYFGIWDAPDYENYGESMITVSNDGRVTGTTADSYTGVYGGTPRGTVKPNGYCEIKVQYPGESASTFIGTFTFTQDGSFVGSGTQYFGSGAHITVEFEFERT